MIHIRLTVICIYWVCSIFAQTLVTPAIPNAKRKRTNLDIQRGKTCHAKSVDFRAGEKSRRAINQKNLRKIRKNVEIWTICEHLNDFVWLITPWNHFVPFLTRLRPENWLKFDDFDQSLKLFLDRNLGVGTNTLSSLLYKHSIERVAFQSVNKSTPPPWFLAPKH